MAYLESVLKVLAIGLLLGAGLPAVFAAGLVAYSNGAGGQHADGTSVAPNPAVKFLGIGLFALVGWVIRLQVGSAFCDSDAVVLSRVSIRAA